MTRSRCFAYSIVENDFDFPRFLGFRPRIVDRVVIVLLYRIFLSNLVLYLVAFGDKTWKLSKLNFVISVGQCPINRLLTDVLAEHIVKLKYQHLQIKYLKHS